jgi:hypothetical protein
MGGSSALFERGLKWRPRRLMALVVVPVKVGKAKPAGVDQAPIISYLGATPDSYRTGLRGSEQEWGRLDLDGLHLIPQFSWDYGRFDGTKVHSPKWTKVLRRRSCLFG